jgi:hypothetical protein
MDAEKQALKALMILVITLLVACGRKEAQPSGSLDAVADKMAFYRSQPQSWVHSKCDGLLFTSLCKVAGGCAGADIFAAESKTEPGRWFRSPEQDCFDLGQSRSDFSRDMLLGLLHYLWETKDRAALERLYAHGVASNFVMGRYDGTDMLVGRAQWISFASIVRAMIQKLGGSTGLDEPRQGSDDAIFALPGFEGHIQVLRILLSGRVYNGVTITQTKILREQAQRQPRNALFQAAHAKYSDGDYSKAVAILQDSVLFPDGRLPTSSDRCEEYLWQRDDGADWLPCDKGATHSGTDLIFAAKVIEGF